MRVHVPYSKVFIFSFESLWHHEQSIEGKVIVRTTTPVGFSNDFIVSPPCHPFLWEVIMSLQYSNRWYIFPYANTMFSTGKGTRKKVKLIEATCPVTININSVRIVCLIQFFYLISQTCLNTSNTTVKRGLFIVR